MEEKFEFIFNGAFELEEATGNNAILNGVFLRLNKVTNNGREYQIEEGELIAEGLKDMPVFFGSIAKYFPGTRILRGFKHDKTNKPIGRVFKAIFDKADNIIKGAVEVWNTSRFPDLVQKIQKGWGFSIGGTALDLIPTGLLNKLGRKIMRVIQMRPHHVQLLEPHINRGQEEAQVENVKEVEEVLQFDPCPPWGDCSIEETTQGIYAPEDLETKDPNIETPEVITSENITGGGTATKIEASEIPVKTFIIKKIRKRIIYSDDPNTIVVG